MKKSWIGAAVFLSLGFSPAANAMEYNNVREIFRGADLNYGGESAGSRLLPVRAGSGASFNGVKAGLAAAYADGQKNNLFTLDGIAIALQTIEPDAAASGENGRDQAAVYGEQAVDTGVPYDGAASPDAVYPGGEGTGPARKNGNSSSAFFTGGKLGHHGFLFTRFPVTGAFVQLNFPAGAAGSIFKGTGNPGIVPGPVVNSFSGGKPGFNPAPSSARSVPEPASVVLLGLTLGALAFVRKRRLRVI